MTMTTTNANPEIDKNNLWIKIATRLLDELSRIDVSTDLSSKERQSAKQKVEAMAAEEAGVPAVEWMEWYQQHQHQHHDVKEEAPQSQKSTPKETKDPETRKREAAAQKLKKELVTIEGDEAMKAKDRRSAKRKAEAIASEDSGMTAQDLLDWYESILQSRMEEKKKDISSMTVVDKKRNHDPYIAFVGQLSFDTTADELYQHIHDQLKDDFKFKRSDVKVRILTDSSTKKSRGMAFVEVEDPELLYGLLKLHQTFLKGRRINIERSAGGKKSSDARKAKLAQFRKEQDEYFAEVVDKIMKEYKDTGELREGELDDGVISLCKRHAGPVVKAAVAEYMEKGGRDMDNPSAYLSFLVTKFATEGIRDDKEDATKNSKPKRKGGGDSSSSGPRPNKKPKESSEFKRAGIDMSMSDKLSGGRSNLAKVFPSARRGRGRGYM